MVTSVLEPKPSVSLPRLFRFTVEQLHQMLETGVIQDGAPIELIDGVLIQKDRRDAGGDPMTPGTRHAKAVRRLSRVAATLIPLGYDVHTQQPVTLAEASEPEPDAAIVVAREDDYEGQHPSPKEVAVVFEVAYSSLRYDRSIKKEMYAAAGIPLYCIVNLRDDVIEVYASPDSQAAEYREQSTLTGNDALNLVLDSDSQVEVKVADLLP